MNNLTFCYWSLPYEPPQDLSLNITINVYEISKDLYAYWWLANKRDKPIENIYAGYAENHTSTYLQFPTFAKEQNVYILVVAKKEDVDAKGNS